MDSGEEGSRIINGLKEKFVTNSAMQADMRWDESHFRTFAKTDFELYYPQRFQSKVREVLALPHGQGKQDSKKDLLKEVIQWAHSSPDNRMLAKAEFAESAAEVIAILKEIELRLSR